MIDMQAYEMARELYTNLIAPSIYELVPVMLTIPSISHIRSHIFSMSNEPQLRVISCKKKRNCCQDEFQSFTFVHSLQRSFSINAFAHNVTAIQHRSCDMIVTVAIAVNGNI